MRQARSTDYGATKIYVPDVRSGEWDNRKDPRPITVEYRVPTEGDRRKAMFAGRASGDPTAWVPEIVRSAVLSVENYNDGKGRPITNGNDLAEHGEDFVLIDIGLEIHRQYGLSDEQRKNSDGSPGSGCQATKAKTGTAESAGNTGSTGKGIATESTAGSSM